MGKTSSEVKNAWNAKTYKRYQVSLRYDVDGDLIEFIEKNREKYSITDYFRAGVETIKQEG